MICWQASGGCEGPILRIEVRFCSKPYEEVIWYSSIDTPSVTLDSVDTGVGVVVVMTFILNLERITINSYLNV